MTGSFGETESPSSAMNCTKAFQFLRFGRSSIVACTICSGTRQEVSLVKIHFIPALQYIASVLGCSI